MLCFSTSQFSMSKTSIFLLVVFLLFYSLYTVDSTTIPCSKTPGSVGYTPGTNVCIGYFMEKDSSKLKFVTAYTTITTRNTCDVNDPHFQGLLQDWRCARGYYMGCCDTKHCMDTINSNTFVKCNATYTYKCSTDFPRVAAQGKGGQCIAVYHSNASGSKLMGVKTEHLDSPCFALMNTSSSKYRKEDVVRCPVGQFYKCCEGKVSCVDDLTSGGAVPCASKKVFLCSKNHMDLVRTKGQSVCVAIFDNKTAGLKPIEVKLSNTKVCSNTKHKFRCNHTKFYACCDEEVKFCVDDLKSEYSRTCIPDVECSSTAKWMKMTHYESVCFILFNRTDASDKGKVSVQKFPSCQEAEKNLKTICTTESRLYYCCKKKHCLDKVKAVPLKPCPSTITITTTATTTTISSVVPKAYACSSMNVSKVMVLTKSVCFKIYDDKSAKTGKISVQNYATCTEAKKKLKKICTGEFFICCDKELCLDRVSVNDATDCSTPLLAKLPCSSNSTEVMEKGVSVCFSVFEARQKGKVGKMSVQKFSSCAQAEKKLKLICAGNFYVCCDSVNCLDGGKAEASKSCESTESTTGGTGDILCLFSSSELVLKNGRGVCVLFKRPSGTFQSREVSLFSDCASAENFYCSIDSYFYCCKSHNCLSGAESELKICDVSSAETVMMRSRILYLIVILFYINYGKYY